MNLLDQVVTSNDEATSLMLLGRNAEANTLLLQCLEMVKSSIIHGNQFDPPVVSDPVLEEGGTMMVVPSIRGLSRTDSYVYARPLFYRHIYSAYNFRACSKAFVSIMISATVVFNLALLHHCLGNQTGSEAAFAKARQLYTMTIGLVNSTRSKTSEYPSEIRVLASNNLCHLLFLQSPSVSSYREAQQLASSVQLQMSQLRHTNGNDFSHLVLIRDVWDEILINVFSWQHFKMTKSAASAA